MKKNLFLVMFLVVTIFQEINARPNTEEQNDCCCNKKDQTISKYPPIYLPYSCHYLSEISASKSFIILEDGSAWQIDKETLNNVLSWKSSDVLFIYPNDTWFSNHKYKIVNQSLGKSIGASLSFGPFSQGEYTIQIKEINPTEGIIYLNDGSRWFTCEQDKEILNEWTKDDYIIVGTNNSCFCALKNILINSKMFNYIRAQQF